MEKFEDNQMQMAQPDLIIPPLNTDVRFGESLPFFIGEEVDSVTNSYTHANEIGVFNVRSKAAAGSHEHDSSRLHVHDHEHENFSWTIASDHDDAHSLQKKLRMGPILDQQGCGSCWAFAVASTMADCLVVGEAVDYVPHISPTFCLACFPQGQCNGGNPAELALTIEKYGVSDQSCLDYSWCDSNEMCNIRDSSKHFSIDSRKLNEMIPNCGCMFRNNKYVYYLDKGTDTFSITNDVPIEEFRKLVKYHILDFGPVIGGFAVLTNFQSGKFTKTNEGVYFDRADYDNISTDGTIPFSDSVKSSINTAGLHAVSIVGWGLAKNVQYDNSKVGDVPFWYCRNSWGTKWGDKGYFKIAMYPFNQTSQFDKVVAIRLANNATAQIGGLMFIRATKPPKVAEIKQIDDNYKRNIKLNNPDDFYDRDVVPGRGIIAEAVSNAEKNMKLTIIIVILLIVIFVLWFRRRY